MLYFTGIYIAVHLEAQKLGLKGIPRDELPKFGPLMKKIYLLAPLVVLVVLVSTNTFTMQFSASVAIFIAIAVGLINKDNRITWKKILDALEAGGKGTITVAVACAMAGIVAGCITSTDVYKRQVTPRILNCLEANGARATFFMVGNRVPGNASLVQRMAALNCEVANHTYTHANLTKLSPDGIVSTIAQTNQAVANACGVTPKLVRPTGGSYNSTVLQSLGNMGMPAKMCIRDSTVEANYNGDMTPYNIPHTACHELSHLRGFMREDEANFIGYLACIGSGDADFIYSGYLLGFIYAGNALAARDYRAYADLYYELPEAVQEDLLQNYIFWEAWDGAVAEAANRMNDTYLKINDQKDGVESYGLSLIHI